VYDDVFVVWETIWAAKHVSSPHFVLFLALALVEYYREIIIDNSMDFTDIIKFFNGIVHRDFTTVSSTHRPTVDVNKIQGASSCLYTVFHKKGPFFFLS